MDKDYSMGLYGFGAFSVFMWIVFLAIYILQATAMFKMYQKANIKHAWLAYVPIAQMWPFFWAIKKSAWNILWFLLPIAGIVIGVIILAVWQDTPAFVIYIILVLISAIIPTVLYIIWMARLFKAYNMSPLWLLGLIGCVIPIVNFLVSIGFVVLYCYMGFSSKVQYNPDFDARKI